MLRPAVAVVAALSLGACGGEDEASYTADGGEDEASYTAESFLEAVDRQGADLALAGRLPAAGEREIFSVTPRGHGREATGEHEHGGSVTLVVAESEEAAIYELDRCESAITLTCFRAANLVGYLEQGDPALASRVARVFRDLETGQ